MDGSDIQPGMQVTIGRSKHNGDGSFASDIHRVIGVNATHVVIDWRFMREQWDVERPHALLRSEYDFTPITLHV